MFGFQKKKYCKCKKKEMMLERRLKNIMIGLEVRVMMDENLEEEEED